MAGSFLESLSSKADGLSEAGVTSSHLDLLLGNLSSPIFRMAQLNANLVYGDVNPMVLNNSTNSGASSLIMDAYSPLLRDAHLQERGSINTEPYLNLPSSPMSFSSNYLSTSVRDGSSVAQQFSHLDQGCGQGCKRQQPQQQVGSKATSQLTSQTRHVPFPNGVKQGAGSLTQAYKRPRLEIDQDDILHQQIVQQLLQRQDLMQLHEHDIQLNTLMQQHKLQNHVQQQILHSIPQLQGVNAQHLQQQMGHHLQQRTTHQVSAFQSLDGGICSRRLMQYLYHLQQRPRDNSIAYWRKFVTEYYAPCAKKKWCLSMYENIGKHAIGVFSQVAMEAWHCGICGSKSGKGFEAVFEILPRLSKVNFESGVLDELLFLDLPQERRFPSGIMMLEYGKAVQESVYDQFRVVREGKLRILFRNDLKILSWEFCARHHEEFFLRRLVVPQVNQLVQAAHKYRSTIINSVSNGVPPKDLQMFVKAGHQLARNLELPLVNDLGFAKRYVRCLQTAEVVNSMKDLMTFSLDQNIGPIESLKTYPQERTVINIQMKEMLGKEQQGSPQGLLADRNKLVAAHISSSSNINNCGSPITNDRILSSSGEVALALANYHQKLLKQNSTNSIARTIKQEQPCSMNCSSQKATSSTLLGAQPSNPGLPQNLQTSGGLSRTMPSQSSKNLQQQMIDKLLQEMVADSRAKGVHSTSEMVNKELFHHQFGRSAAGGLPTGAGGTGMISSGLGFGNSTADLFAQANRLGSVVGSAENFNSSRGYSNILIKKEPDSPEFRSSVYENGVLNSEW